MAGHVRSGNTGQLAVSIRFEEAVVANLPSLTGVIKWDPFWGGSNLMQMLLLILWDFLH